MWNQLQGVLQSTLCWEFDFWLKSTGIFPTNRNVISSLTTKPSEIFVSANNDTADETESANDITDLSVPEDFFES